MLINRITFYVIFLLGVCAIIWMGLSFIGTDLLALTVTGAIAAVYVLGFVELFKYRQATATLTDALAELPSSRIDGDVALADWIASLHSSLRNSVSLRIQGERAGLPSPIFTPYLVGLLVMLGLLGTFVGMVETLGGAVAALEGTTELEAIRNGLAAPIRGLGLAFGTSVAGVATSAMLGLNSTLCRRDRMLATRELDSVVATVFREFTLNHNRQEAYNALEAQAQALPDVAQRLEQLATGLEQMGDRLSAALVDNQKQFHASATTVFSELAGSVQNSLQQSLEAGGRLAGESITPVVAGAMATINERFEASNSAMMDNFDKASQEWIDRQESGDQQRLAQWTDTLRDNQQKTTDDLSAAAEAFSRLLGSSEELVQARIASESGWLDNQSRLMTDLTTALRSELDGIRQAESQREAAVVERMANLEGTVAKHVASLGRELEEPMTRLIATASETPRAAAEVIGELRKEISSNIERDNKMLAERQQIMSDLGTLFSAQDLALKAQQDSMNTLVSSSSDMLQEIGARFSEKVTQEVGNISGATAEFAGSATEMASLSEAFSLAVELFNDSNRSLVDQLASIEASLDKSGSRSDEQMGYYVAQAREIIDHSMQSQREIIEQMRKLGQQKDLFTAEAS
ncbi:MAG: hypothetical protein ABJ056_12110 [Halioglobus sp.]